MRTLAEITLDLWLLVQRGPDLELPGGRPFERAVADVLRRPGFDCVQQAGLHALWGLPSASGAAHEIDAAAKGRRAAYLVEAKAMNRVGKADLAVFEQKVSDFYFARWRTVAHHRWWAVLASAGEVTDATRRIACHRAIVLTDPRRLPLPVLYHHARRPDTELCRRKCSALMRLLPRAIAAIQQRYVPNLTANCLTLSPCPYTQAEVDDLLALQDDFSEDILERYDQKLPGLLEAREARLHQLLYPRAA